MQPIRSFVVRIYRQDRPAWPAPSRTSATGAAAPSSPSPSLWPPCAAAAATLNRCDRAASAPPPNDPA
jgi:hypothetical protein